MAREILFIADDFGLSDEVNEAILHAHREGALHGASLMMGQPGSEAAVELARAHPRLQIGWHLHLTDSRPLSLSVWPWGRSPARAGLAMGLSSRVRGLVRREIDRQWQAFLDTELPCRFVNSHHHLHIHPFVMGALRGILPREWDGWLRWGRPCFFDGGLRKMGYRGLELSLQSLPRRRSPFRLSTTLWGIDRTFDMKAREVRGILPTLGDGLHEFIFHPRRLHSDPDTTCLLDLGTVAV